MSAYAAVVSLKSILSNYLFIYDVIFQPEFYQILQLLLKKLKSFQNFVERLDIRSRKRMNASLERVSEDIRKFTDQFLEYEVGYHVLIIGKAHSLIETLTMMEEEYCSLLEDDEEAVSSSSSSLRVNVSMSKIIGLINERRQLKEDIVNFCFKNTVYTLFGMAGIGKTTLAREIFEDLDIQEWFDCRAWVTVGNPWKSEETIEAILAQVNPDAHKGLKQSLKGKRYLIVLDDVWSYEVHQHLKKLLPDSENGSRVLITSRMKYVGNAIISSTATSSDFLNSHLIDVRLLNKEESWHLLRDKVFAGDSCPLLLEEAGKMIAEKCDGLPLTIVTVAELLSNTPESLWIDIAVRKKHQLFIDAYDQISKVLYPSYKILIDELKSCFLYLGVFPLKYEIPRSKLTNLWIAEEVVEPSRYRTLEKLESIAGGYLHSLSLQSLVMVCKSSNSLLTSGFIDEKIKTCGLHSSWWHFCQREARRTYFFYVLDCYQDGLEAGIRRQIRLSVHNNVLFALKDVYNSMEENCASTTQSLLCFGPYHPYQVPVCFALKLLQRLDALNIRFYDFPLEVVELVELRYLALTCNGNLPPTISKLWKLRYLFVHPHLSIKSSEALSHLPMEIWDMKELELLDVMGYDLPDLGHTSLPKLAKLSNATTGSCSVLKRVPDLRKLGIRIEMKADAAELLCCFDHISHLIKLQSLKCVIVNPNFKLEVVSPIAPFHCFPYFLNKLSFSGLGYPWQEMSKIALLPYLQVLKLKCDAFRGPVWEVEENGFQKLHSLLLESIDLVKLKGATGSLKCLQLLSMKHCYKLKELHLGHFQSVWKIEVEDCNPLVEMNIKRTMRQSGHTPQYLRVHYSWKS